MRDFDVLGLGEPLIEFNQIERGQPGFRQGIGGDTFNAVVAAARQGARTSYIGRIGGADDFGRLLREAWRSEGVDASGMVQDPEANNGLYFIEHDEQGHRFSYVRRHSAASRMQPADLDSGLIERSRFLHVSGISLGLSQSACDTVFAAMERARQAGTRVCLDANLRLKLWPLARARAILREAIAQADVFLPGMDDMQQLTGLQAPQAVLDWTRAVNPRAVVVLKRGRDGVMLDHDGRRHAVAPCKVEAVDATGAGDCFAGSLLARLSAGDDWIQAVEYANAAAALSTTRYGAVAALPRADEVRAFMARAQS
ncbi:sugar kinase [Orrella sp. JC864]|uniref:sugar kinase n=1 Tax=Orrella sp. JC864 TaxID=3120298 RepID=UPI00300A8997